MKLDFDLNNVRATEFGVGQDDREDKNYVCVAVDAGVQAALQDMVTATWGEMQKLAQTPAQYEPSEKHESHEYLFLPLDDVLAVHLQQLHQADNLTSDNKALEETSSIFCYFVRLTDKKGRRLTAVRRAAQFKGVLKSRLVRLVTDSLKIVEDRVFKLDVDFDLLVDSRNVFVLRPAGFEFVGMLQEAVCAAVPTNISLVQAEMPFVDFSGIEAYATGHPRAARYLASIRAQRETTGVDRQALRRCCSEAGVGVNLHKGKIEVQAGHEMGFLEVLDRRRYTLELVQGAPERFKAASRQKLES